MHGTPLSIGFNETPDNNPATSCLNVLVQGLGFRVHVNALYSDAHTLNPKPTRRFGLKPRGHLETLLSGTLGLGNLLYKLIIVICPHIILWPLASCYRYTKLQDRQTRTSTVKNPLILTANIDRFISPP